MLASLAFDTTVISAARATVPAWRRRAGTIALWLSGPSHPPLGLRRAIIRARWPLAASPDADTPVHHRTLTKQQDTIRDQDLGRQPAPDTHDAGDAQSGQRA